MLNKIIMDDICNRFNDFRNHLVKSNINEDIIKYFTIITSLVVLEISELTKQETINVDKPIQKVKRKYTRRKNNVEI